MPSAPFSFLFYFLVRRACPVHFRSSPKTKSEATAQNRRPKVETTADQKPINLRPKPKQPQTKSQKSLKHLAKKKRRNQRKKSKKKENSPKANHLPSAVTKKSSACATVHIKTRRYILLSRVHFLPQNLYQPLPVSARKKDYLQYTLPPSG